MSFALKDIAYGWKIGVAVVLTGTTIYTAGNVLMRIMQRDAVQVILGTYERTLALQTGTNADGSGIYPIALPSYVRNWYSNDYVSTITNGVTNWTAVLYTNTFTNVISERLDHAMLVSLDATIKALVPYYCNTSSVYDGTTQIDMLTFTGLLASLNLGDHTNFTSIPAIGTNLAIYGPWAWRNYIVAWQERYKVLNAMKTRLLGINYVGTNFPGVVMTAKFSGQGDTATGGYCNVYYGWPDNVLGPANGDEYDITIDARSPGGLSQRDYITLGAGEVLPYNSMEFKLDTSSGTNFPTFSSELTLNADPAFVTILNCFSAYYTNAMCSHTPSSATVSVNLDRTVQAVAHVSIYGVIYFPFQYCTNKYW